MKRINVMVAVVGIAVRVSGCAQGWSKEEAACEETCASADYAPHVACTNAGLPEVQCEYHGTWHTGEVAYCSCTNSIPVQ